MMNYFSFAPNFGLQLQQCPPGFTSRPLLTPSFILSTLSLALTSSITNYQNATIASSSPSQPSPDHQPLSNPQKNPLPPKDSIEPIQTEIQLTVQKQNKGNSEEKTQAIQIPPETDAKPSQIPLKVQQRGEQKLPAVVAGRQQNNKKRVQENGKAELGKASQVPRVDLIETAYLGKHGLEEAVLEDKRIGLLSRRVDEWSDKGKSRRDKRELRLLQN